MLETERNKRKYDCFAIEFTAVNIFKGIPKWV